VRLARTAAERATARVRDAVLAARRDDLLAVLPGLPAATHIGGRVVNWGCLGSLAFVAVFWAGVLLLVCGCS
jgi:hypothetical protein